MKLAVDGNLQIPGSIILTLKKYYKVEKRREGGGEREREREKYYASTSMFMYTCTC